MDSLKHHMQSALRQTQIYLHNRSRFLTLDPRNILGLWASILVLTWLAYITHRRLFASPARRPNSPDPEKRFASGKLRTTVKAPDRKPGVWISQEFKRPDPPPYPDWDVRTTKPLPYRPFKYGPYYITMGLR